MKNSEEAIGRVLAGLRDVDTPDGMGRRILEGLEEQTAISSRSGWRRFIPMSLVILQQKVGASGLVCAATLTGVLVVL